MSLIIDALRSDLGIQQPVPTARLRARLGTIPIWDPRESEVPPEDEWPRRWQLVPVRDPESLTGVTWEKRHVLSVVTPSNYNTPQ